MKKITLEDIEERCNKATAGPWISYVEGRNHTSGCSFIKTTGEDIELIGVLEEDQDFIANARQDIPWLLNEIYRLKKMSTL